VIDHDKIAPPPSLADILSGGETLIGRVDFDSRLVTEQPADSEPAAAAPVKPAKQVKQVAKTEPVQATEEPAPAEPVDEAPEAPAEDVEHGTDELEDHEELADLDEFDDLTDLTDLDDLDGTGAEQFDEYADAYADPLARANREHREHPRREPTLTKPSMRPEEDVAYLGLSLEEVAESARVRMRAAEVAHLRHLEAIENEAARRLELLTAQAELDAELIRLHARREAHAIVTAARTRTGSRTVKTPAERRLADVGGTFSRFAETLESSIESSVAPDHRSHP
jgi:hypothetical protein